MFETNENVKSIWTKILFVKDVVQGTGYFYNSVPNPPHFWIIGEK